MTIATGEPPGSTITTEPTRWSRISRATETALASGAAVTTPAVMISLSFTARTLPGDEQRTTATTPVVPLEAGAGPENPPCPACGEPLFGWIDLRAGLAGPVSRCESCGLGVVGEPGSVEEALRGAGPARATARRSGSPTAAASPPGSAAPAGPGWSPAAATSSRPSRCAGWSPTATRSSAAARWAPGAGIATMWQTVLNGFTFGRNVALGALGRAPRGAGGQPWQRRLDALICVVVAIPALLVAVPLELIAAALAARRRAEPAARAALTGAAALGEAFAGLADQRHGLGKRTRIASRTCIACSSLLPVSSRRPIEATVISTASLIALSAQATRWEDCICSESSSMRARNSSGSPKRLKGLPSMPGMKAERGSGTS